MDFTDSTTRLVAGTFLLGLLAAVLMLQPTGIVKWLQKKNYQYEVTFALYMMTPTEKFVFNSILFLTLSMLLIACTLYLPDHLTTISQRTYYYFAGDAALLASSKQAAETIYETATKAGDAIRSATSSWAQTAYQAAVNKTVAVAQGAASQGAEVGA